ncbi:MAG TPA: hypothetical protein VF991_18610, partial [Reyranella sp.]
LDRALEGRGSRDEMADVAHERSPVNGRLFRCGAERAIASPLPQCAGRGFDLRTCKAAMSQVRESLSTVEKARIIARNRAFCGLP